MIFLLAHHTPFDAPENWLAVAPAVAVVWWPVKHWLTKRLGKKMDSKGKIPKP